jgi:hypothetical protein
MNPVEISTLLVCGHLVRVRPLIPSAASFCATVVTTLPEHKAGLAEAALPRIIPKLLQEALDQSFALDTAGL